MREGHRSSTAGAADDAGAIVVLIDTAGSDLAGGALLVLLLPLLLRFVRLHALQRQRSIY